MTDNLLALGSFAHDPQRILAAVNRLAFVRIECRVYVLKRIATKLGVAPFADAKDRAIISNDSQGALRHDWSLPHLTGE